MIIRHTSMGDLDQMVRIEEVSYPSAEGASRESICKRIQTFSDCFWVLEDNGKIVAFINGMSTNERDLTDEMYDHAEKHDPNGLWQMIFSVVTDPQYRGNGYATKVMEKLL